METTIVKTENGKNYNKWNQVVVQCKTGCGRSTTMDATKLCDFCWEKERRERNKN